MFSLHIGAILTMLTLVYAILYVIRQGNFFNSDSSGVTHLYVNFRSACLSVCLTQLFSDSSRPTLSSEVLKQ